MFIVFFLLFNNQVLICKCNKISDKKNIYLCKFYEMIAIC